MDEHLGPWIESTTVELDLSSGQSFAEAGKEGRLYRVVLVQEGFSSNASGNGLPRYWCGDMLERQVGDFDGLPIHLNIRHEGQRRRRTHVDRDLGQYDDGENLTPGRTRVGHCRRPRIEVIRGRRSVVADALIANDAAVRAELRSGRWELSVRGASKENPEYRERRLASVVNEITGLDTVDVVDYGAAGGRVLNMVASEEQEMKALYRRLLGRLAPTQLNGLDEDASESALLAKMKAAFGDGFGALLDAVEDDSDAAAELHKARQVYRLMSKDEPDVKQATTLATKILSGEVKGTATQVAAASTKATDDAKAAADAKRKQDIDDAKAAAAAAGKPTTPATTTDATTTTTTTPATMTDDRVAELAKKAVADRMAEFDKDQALQTAANMAKASGLSQPGQESFAESIEEMVTEGMIPSRARMQRLLNRRLAYEAQMDQQSRATGTDGGSIADVTGMTRESFAESFTGIIDKTRKMQAGFWKALGISRKTIERTEGSQIASFAESSDLVGALDMYRYLRGDYNMTGQLNLDRLDPKLRAAVLMTRGQRMQFAEDLQSTDLTYVTADALNKLQLQGFLEIPELELMLASQRTGVTNLHALKEHRLGGFGKLPTRAEGNAYAITANPGDEGISFTPTDQGMQIDVTFETFWRDDTNTLTQLGLNLGRAARQTRQAFIGDALVGYQTAAINDWVMPYDATVLYDAAHGNVQATALSPASLETARQLMVSQTRLGEVVGGFMRPRYLVTPVELGQVGRKLVFPGQEPFTTDNDANVNAPFFQHIELQTSILRGDANNYYVVADPQTNPAIRIAYLFDRSEPELLVQDDPTVGNVLVQKTIKMVISYWFAVALLDHRPLVAGLVA